MGKSTPAVKSSRSGRVVARSPKRVVVTGENAYIAALRKVDAGNVVTFGEIAFMAVGHAGMGSMVQASKAVKSVAEKAIDPPWWRVVATGKGPIGDLLQSQRAATQRKMLLQEGVDLSRPLARGAGLLPLGLRSCFSPVSFHVRPDTKHTHTLIYVHGRGFTGHYYDQRRHFFEVDGLNGLRVVLPVSPVKWTGKPLTEWWSAWPPQECDLEEPGKTISKIINDEVAKVGSSEHVFLGGSSQGCILGLDTFVRYPRCLGGFCGVVGFWPRCSDSAVKNKEFIKAKTQRPIRLLNGEADTIVKPDLVRSSFNFFRKAGFTDMKTVMRQGQGHHLGEREGDWIRSFLAEIIKT